MSCHYFFNSPALVLVHPDVKNWIKYARFEEKHGYFAHARKVYERAVEFFGDEHMDEHLYVAFAKFEENQKEVSKLHSVTLQNSLEKITSCAHQVHFCFLIHLSLAKMFSKYKNTISQRKQHTFVEDWELSDYRLYHNCLNFVVLCLKSNPLYLE